MSPSCRKEEARDSLELLMAEVREYRIWIGLLLLVVLVIVACVFLSTDPAGWDVQKFATVLTALVGLPTLIFLGWSFEHGRSSNAIAAWTTLWQRLQDDGPRAGREILRNANWNVDQRNDSNCARDWLTDVCLPSDKAWQELYRQMECSGRYDEVEWFKKLNKENCAERMLQYARTAFDEFDVAGHVILASGLPSLIAHFTCAYRDGIRECYEKGKFFQIQRLHNDRTELYECITVLYELVKDTRGVEPKAQSPSSYPYITIWEYLRFNVRIKAARSLAIDRIQGLWETEGRSNLHGNSQ